VVNVPDRYDAALSRLNEQERDLIVARSSVWQRS
jgi:hypothetical protein